MNASMKITRSPALSLLLAFVAGAAHAGKIQYTYDSADRVIAAEHGAGKVTTLSYDANGNLLDRSTQTATTADVRFSTSSATPSTTAAGNLFDYSFTITNDGPHPASGVNFLDVLPFGIAPASGTASQGAGLIAGRTADIDLGVLAAGASATITLSARHGFAGSFNNSASVAAVESDPSAANNLTSVATTATAPQDTDSDGIPDWWESQNISIGAPFTDFGDLGAAGDFDGDGDSNMDEFAADTPANDATAAFRPMAFALDGGVFSITFRTSPFRMYAVDASEALDPGFDPLVENIEGTGLEMTVEDLDPPFGRGFYRVRAMIPPP